MATHAVVRSLAIRHNAVTVEAVVLRCHHELGKLVVMASSLRPKIGLIRLLIAHYGLH